MRKRLVAAVGAVVLLGGVGTAYALQHHRTPPPVPQVQPTPYPSRTPLLASSDGTAVPTTAGLTRVLAAALRNKALGTRTAVSVVDVATGRVLMAVGADVPVIPASTAKITTAVAALTVLDPDGTFVTRVVQGAPGDVVLVGGGDPSFDRAHLASLAAQVRRAGTAVRRVVVDDSLFSGPRTGPGWKPGYVQDGDVAPVSALVVDEGRTSRHDGTPRVADPAMAAGAQLARLLGVKAVARGRAPSGAALLAQSASPPVSELVEEMLTHSDNDYAEAIGRQVALASHLPASFTGEAAAVSRALRRLGVQVALRDASGLSPLDRVDPRAITTLLVRAATDGRYGALVSGLPVAGFDGTLAGRFRSGAPAAAAGEVRAKTGTLDGVSALAGLVRTADGRLLAFDLTANGVGNGATIPAQHGLDAVAAELAACGCR